MKFLRVYLAGNSSNLNNFDLTVTYSGLVTDVNGTVSEVIKTDSCTSSSVLNGFISFDYNFDIWSNNNKLNFVNITS